MSDRHYYCGKECFIVADLGDELVIDIETHEVHRGQYEDSYVEPINNRIIVDKNKVLKNLPDWDGEIKERQRELEKQYREKNERLRKEIKDLENQVSLKKSEIRDEVKTLESQVKDLKGAEEILNWFTGKIKYVTHTGDYSYPLKFGVHAIEDLGYKDNERDRYNTLRAVVFRQDSKYHGGRKAGDIEFQISNYSDGSGSEARWVKGFETEEEAVQYVCKFIEDNVKNIKLPFGNGNGIRWEWIEFANKYDFQLDILKQYELYLQEKEAEGRAAEIKKKEEELDILRNRPLGNKKKI